MSTEYCPGCDRLVDTDEELEGIYIRLRYLCSWCCEERDAEDWLNQMRQVSHESV